ncbi:vesicle coat component [Clavispora lusitaniae]|nr:vesicle coat component [Clavispora lusitaniae]
MEGGLEDFSIPGSPEYTTRANSVIGNNGLYSSRLSQSQQTELYHQYEVKDDTVLDYIPVEEDEEDEERSSCVSRAQEDEPLGFKGWIASTERPRSSMRDTVGKAAFPLTKSKRWIGRNTSVWEGQLKATAPLHQKAQPGLPQAVPPTSAAQEEKERKRAGYRDRPIPWVRRAGSPRQPPPRSPVNLAAGLDDLLSLGASAPSRKGKRRYVNIMEK